MSTGPSGLGTANISTSSTHSIHGITSRPTFIGSLQLEERRQALAGCIAKLAAPEQDLLSRRFGDGTAVGDIAAQRGRSADAIYKTLAKIRQVLFECVTRTLAREA